uniref:CCHC-type domain-containing protein n=1 Tax=Tanacetum cinerariifolium TaxID=118510 RepID=A0A6L2MJ39_TANCI|nr:hypothetical protein [Tanacetum cinerariifolium]
MAPKKRTTRASPATTTSTTTPVTNAQLKALVDQGVDDALAARDADSSQNDEDNHDSRTGISRQAPLTRECTYPDFMKCKPLYFKGSEGVVELTQWFKRMEIVFCISNYTVENQIKFATCILLGNKPEKKITDKYCPRGEIEKLEIEMWNLKVKESDKIERYVDGLPDMSHESVMASKPKTIQDVVEFATEKNGRAYAIRPGQKKPYGGSKPLCSKCNYHHDGSCSPKCHKCNRVGHLACDYRSPAAANNQRNLTCYGCGNQGHYHSDCPKLKNQNYGNQDGGTRARGMAHALGGGETNQDLNNMEDDINA